MNVPQAPEHRPPDDPEIVALVDRAVAYRDPAAFGALYDRCLDRVYRYLYYRTGDQTVAEDLTELVFLKAWEAIERFHWQGRPFMAWLYRLAHNVLIDHTRRDRPTTSLNDPERPLDLPSETAAAELSQRLDAQVLARAVSQLTPEQQQLVVLKFVQGHDNAYIAAVMDKREGAVRALQLRALTSLRRLLEAEEITGLDA